MSALPMYTTMGSGEPCLTEEGQDTLDSFKAAERSNLEEVSIHLSELACLTYIKATTHKIAGFSYQTRERLDGEETLRALLDGDDAALLAAARRIQAELNAAIDAVAEAKFEASFAPFGGPR